MSLCAGLNVLTSRTREAICVGFRARPLCPVDEKSHNVREVPARQWSCPYFNPIWLPTFLCTLNRTCSRWRTLLVSAQVVGARASHRERLRT